MLQGAPPGAVKRALLDASRPLAAVGGRVKGGGLFDPALFLLNPGAHLVTSGDVLLLVSSLTFAMSYASDGLDVTLEARAGGPPFSVGFEACDGPLGLCTQVRTWRQDGERLTTGGPVRSVSLRAMADGQQIDASGREVRDRLKFLSF
jgi:hypothetical protein